MIEKLYRRESYVESVKAVTKEKCNRCNGNNIYQDMNGMYYCLDCFEYGEISDQMIIYRYQREIPLKHHVLETGYELSSLQIKGSDFLMDCYENKHSGFLQAVCGAGKTEMTFQVILAALNRNQKVCFVIPRVSVLKEIYQRFLKHFPDTVIKALYEGNKDFNGANLIISTPQQLIYFYSEFDLAIIDEVDAYPFANNRFLKRLLEKAMKPYGVMVYMSATITKEFSSWIKENRISTYLIPSRFHRRPQVIPVFKRIKNQKTISKILIQLLSQPRQTLVFVPTIDIGLKYKKMLEVEGFDIDFVSSKEKYQRLIINRFRNKEIKMLLATTILERGVTFPDIDCVVLHSQHRVFTKETLIQISGRVGRMDNDDQGSVIFFHESISNAMLAAKKEIYWMNKQNEMRPL